MCPPQRPNGGPPDNTCFNMWSGGGGEASSRLPQRLTVTSDGSKGGAPSNRRREPWSDRPGTALHAKTKVLSGGKLDVENMEIRETYLGMGGLNIRDKTNRFLQCGNYGTKNSYISPDGTGRTHW